MAIKWKVCDCDSCKHYTHKSLRLCRHPITLRLKPSGKVCSNFKHHASLEERKKTWS